MNPIKEKDSPYEANLNPNVTLTVGAEAATASDCIRVSAQFKNKNGTALTEKCVARFYLSDVATGLGVTGTGPTTVAAGSKGAIILEVSRKNYTVMTDANGIVEIDLTDAGTSTWYMVMVLPNGRFVISGAITFA